MKPDVKLGQVIKILEAHSPQNSWAVGLLGKVTVEKDSEGDVRVELVDGPPPWVNTLRLRRNKELWATSWEFPVNSTCTKEHLADLETIYRELKEIWRQNSFCTSSWNMVEGLGAQLSTGRWEKPKPPTERGAMIKANVRTATGQTATDVILVRPSSTTDTWLIVNDVPIERTMLADREIESFVLVKAVEA